VKGDSDAESIERVARLVHRLAVLLAAGVAPHSAWKHVATGGGQFERDVARGVEVGASVTGAILANLASGTVARGTVAGGSAVRDSSPWRAVAAAWQVASTAGAPLAPALRSFAGSLRELAESRRDVRVALAGPVATTRVVLLLPAVGLLFGVALGFDTLGVLFGTAPGLFCLASAAGLLLGARGWNRRLVRSATPLDDTPGLRADLVAIAIAGGSSLDRALESVEIAIAACGVSASGVDAVASVIDLSRRAGVPAAELLRAEADEIRRASRSDARQAAQKLSVTLMIPLGVCVLPAFMLVGVAPLLIAVISSTVTQL